MKKLLIIGLTIFALLVLSACNDNSETQNNAPNQNEAQANVSTAMESLVGAWDLVNAGILIIVHADGTWETSWGDIEYRGNTKLTQDNGDYIAEFIILEQRGPGAMYDSDGNIRPEAFNVETNEHYWIPYPDEYSSWLVGIFSADHDRLVIESVWGAGFDYEQEMERVW